MSRRTSLWLLLACLVLSLAAVIYPLYVIWPMRRQGAGELAAALWITRWRGWFTILAALMALAACVGYWRARRSIWRRGLATLAVLLVCALAWLARVNIYEMMFHPDLHPSFGVASAGRLDKDEKVIAVNWNGHARAYPIRIISYHHVINDVVDGRGIAATY